MAEHLFLKLMFRKGNISVRSFSRRGTSTVTPSRVKTPQRRTFVASLLVAVVALLAFSVAASATTTATDLPTQSAAYNSAWQPAPSGYTVSDDGLGTGAGKIGHVWVIVLENHAYSSNFTPLEGTQSSYLQGLPSQGALLTNYYGTGHSSLDNYLSMVSGQAPTADDQDDCPSYDAMDGSEDSSGTPATNADFGQFESNAGPDAPAGDNGCVYPSSVNTVFNQLNNASDSWKVYAQDLAGGYTASGAAAAPTAGQDAGYTGGAYNYTDCGAPESTVQAAPDLVGTYSSPAAGAGSTFSLNFSSTTGGSDTGDMYVAKHNPLPWFSSLLGTNSCSSTHLAPLFGTSDALSSDLSSASTTPDLSLIVPNNCSNGHDAICKGNNLTGETNGYAGGYTTASTIPAEASNTGGTVAESQFLSVVIPEIEASAAFQANGMIVVTYDEAYPSFTYSGDSQADSQLQSADATGVLSNDAAGETLYGRSLNWEPTGPDATIVTGPTGQVLTAGPGDSAYLDRPSAADQTLVACPTTGADSGSAAWLAFTAPNGSNGQCSPGFQANEFLSGGSAAPTTIHLDMTSGQSTGTTSATETGVTPGEEGAQVTSFNSDTTLTDNFSDPANGSWNDHVYIGQVTNAANSGTTTTATSAYTTSLQFVDNEGNPLTYTGATVSQAPLVLTVHPDDETDPFYDAFDATLGGGDTGAVVISPYVKPGTVSNSYYDHYSLLRTIEDIFGEQSDGSNTLTGGIEAGGTTGGSAALTDGPYLGFAAQPGLAPFGTDVFSWADSPGGVGPATPTVTDTTTVTKTNTATVTYPTQTQIQTVTQTKTKTVTLVKAVVPYLVGDTLAEAKKELSAAGLDLGKVTTKSGKGTAVVTSSSPKAGSEQKEHTKVDLTLAPQK
jgi:hypothetical protein